MIEFLDTSVLVAGSVQAHPHHERSFPLLLKASADRTVCSVHSIAEFYSSMTRLPFPVRQSPMNTVRIFKGLWARLSFVGLTAAEYLQTLESAALVQAPGAQIYDALLVACARKVDAERIYTWNLGHFRAVAPDLAERIVEPGS